MALTKNTTDNIGEKKTDFIAEAESYVEGAGEKHLRPDMEDPDKECKKALIVVAMEGTEEGTQAMVSGIGGHEGLLNAAAGLLTHKFFGPIFREAFVQIMLQDGPFGFSDPAKDN